MAHSQKLQGAGCFVPFFMLAAIFGFAFVAAPVGWILGRSAMLHNDDPVRWYSMLGTVLLLIPYALTLRPKALPPNSPYLDVPRPVGPGQVYSELTCSRPAPRFLHQFDSPQEVSLILYWLAPLRTFFALWFCLIVGGWLLQLADSSHLAFLQPMPARLLVVTACLIPALYRAPRDWALLEERRRLDHRLLFDFENRRLSLVDLQKLEENEVWNVPFDQVRVELTQESDRARALVLRVPGQQKPLTLEVWPSKVSKADAQPLRDALAARMASR